MEVNGIVSGMDEDQLTDLKQFILATISQATADLPRRDEVFGRIDSLQADMQQGFADIQEAIGDALATSKDDTDQRLKNHEQRITKLEQRVV